MPTPGHTPGSVSVVLENREVIVDDLIMGGFVRRKRPCNPIFANDINQVKKTIEEIMKNKPRKLYASHGGPFSPEDVLRYFNLNLA